MKVTIEWKAFPQNKPDELGEYLVQLDDGSMDVQYWDVDRMRWSWNILNGLCVSWSELPKPFKSEKQ